MQAARAELPAVNGVGSSAVLGGDLSFIGDFRPCARAGQLAEYAEQQREPGRVRWKQIGGLHRYADTERLHHGFAGCIFRQRPDGDRS